MVDLIPHREFGCLRLADFAPSVADVVEVRDWEFMEDRWVGEALGAFTEFLRLEEDPDIVRAVSLDFAELSSKLAAAILAALRLPLRPGMALADLEARLGPSVRSEAFVPDRGTYEFRCGTAEPYVVSCTVHEAAGLVYLTVMAPTPRRLAYEHLERAT